MTFKEVEIPENIIDEAREYRGKLLEAVAEFDDNLLEKYFEDENSLTEREILKALREATISGKVIPMMCGSAFKNKGVQAMLDMVMEILPSPLDVEAIIGTNPDTDAEESRKPSVEAPFAALALRLQLILMLEDYVLRELIQEF
jgi:elongation factor G